MVLYFGGGFLHGCNKIGAVLNFFYCRFLGVDNGKIKHNREKSKHSCVFPYIYSYI